MPLNSLGQNLRIGLFRFTIVPRQPLLVPAVNKGNMLRGGFGHAFRKLCCIPQCRDTRTCPLLASCPYKLIFEPSPPQGSERLSKNQDIPRPFVFRPPLTHQTTFQKDEAFEFELVLIGRALDFLPYFVLSFRELADEGLGLNRAHCTLQRVVELGMPERNAAVAPDAGDAVPTNSIFDSTDQVFRTPEGICAGQWIETRVNSLSSNGACILSPPLSLKVRFLTPTFLRVNGEIIREPEFHHFFKRLRDRINALCTFYGEGALDVDFHGLGERAETVRTVSANFKWSERYRTSSRTQQRHELSGFVGEANYDGELREFIPWVLLGELIHLGKHAAWGNGWLGVRTRCLD